MRFDGACGRVTFGQATHDDYQAKIAELDKHIAGTSRSRDKFEAIDSFIVSRGVACLDDLDPADQDDFLAMYVKVAA